MEANRLVRTSVPVFLKSPDCDSLAMVRILEGNGFSTAESRNLVEFLPLAFGRVLLDILKVRTADTFTRVDKNGRELPKVRLVDEPFFRESLGVAQELLLEDKDSFTTIAMHSSEVQAVNKAMYAGRKPENLTLSAPILVWPG